MLLKKEKQGYTWLFNSIDFTIKGGTCSMLALIQRIQKNILLIYLPTLRQWTMDTRNFTNSECSWFFLKGEQA